VEPTRSRGDSRYLRRRGHLHRPQRPRGLTGRDIAEYAAGLFAAFPDLSFDLLGHDSAGDGVVAQWVMRGTNTGPLRGNPPTGARVALPGADFIVQEGGRIRSVRGYFNRSDFAEQLGLQVIVSPYSVGSVSFGDSVYLQLGKRTKPAAFCLTSLSVRSDQEAREVRGYGQRILREMSRMPGVIGVLTARVGNRMLTATAWEDTESPRQMLRGSAHAEAVGRFFGSDFTAGGMTSVWRPERINAMWVRCAACGSMEDYELSGKTYRCGQSLPEPPPYW
jgi:predicted ester cyclase